MTRCCTRVNHDWQKHFVNLALFCCNRYRHPIQNGSSTKTKPNNQTNLPASRVSIGGEFLVPAAKKKPAAKKPAKKAAKKK